ncbi:MAG: sulfur carrier protein ThiS [Desulfobacterales bacterium]|nr:sulfur carrier protein ThiS [Desulfobacterales bacterium]
MTITVNGKKEEILEATSIIDFLVRKNLNPDKVVVEHNLNIIDKKALKDIMLKENDTLEVLRFVGGG